MNVEEDQIGSHHLGVCQRRLAVEGVDHGDALVLERQADEVDHVRLVVGDQDRQHDGLPAQARCQGRPSVTTRTFGGKPTPGRPAGRASRPLGWAAALTRYRPSPGAARGRYFTSTGPFMFGWSPQVYS